MKSLKILYSILFFLPVLFMASCQDDQYELGSLLDPSDIHFRVEQDLATDPGGNTVILINETPEAIPMWDYGTGRSNRQVDTVRFAFKGEYVIRYSALTAGGIVEMDPVTIEVTEDNLNYVSDPLWTALTGGVGEKKTWLLDLDANGVSRYFDGPLYFYGTQVGWEGECLVEEGDCWNWNPDYAGNSWLMPAGDYGSMTFSLQGGPYVTVNHQMISARGEESGTYFLDANAKTLSMTDATPLHDEGRDACVADWGNIRLLSLNEDAMQLAVMRKDECEGAVLLVYNFISQEYADNWVPEEPGEEGPDEGFDPQFAAGELLYMLTGGVGTGRTWELDAAGNPVDWVASGRGWTTSANDSRDWGWNASWDEVAADSWIRFDRFGGQNYTRFQNGETTTGTFTINEENNEILLSDANTLIQNPGSWMNPTTSTIKVVKAFPGEFESKGIWLGTAYDEGKDEWLVFHYVLPVE